jgi:hypothetical protein
MVLLAACTMAVLVARYSLDRMGVNLETEWRLIP